MTCEDMVHRLPEFAHIRMNLVAVSFSQTRNSQKHGVFATLTPLRFPNGTREQMLRGYKWRLQTISDGTGTDFLYLLDVFVPRFINMTLLEKLGTIAHELYHISPQFNGDIRRFSGRCFAHGSSRKQYDAKIMVLVHRWLQLEPPPDVWDYLQFSFTELQQKYDRIHGSVFRSPKLQRVLTS